MKIQAIVTSAFACAAAGAVSAAPIHVDAVGDVGGNTVNTSTGSVNDWITTVNDANDALWRDRAFGIGGTHVYEVFTEAGNGDQNAPGLTTTITGLTPGQQYNVFVDYIRFGVNAALPTGNRGGITAGLTAGSLTTFGDLAAGITANGHAQDDRIGLRGALGVATADANGEIDVFVTGEIIAGDERAWLDGVAHEEVPEPGSLALLGLGGLALLRRRRA